MQGSHRGRREPLTRERILAAATLLVDREGLTALSMRHLGRELGVEGMSLYNHIPNKEMLLVGLIENMFAPVRLQHEVEGDWREKLAALMRSMRRAGLDHPEIFTLFSARPWDIHASRIEEELVFLHNAGFSDDDAGHALRTLSSFCIGFVAREISNRIHGDRKDRFEREYEATTIASNYPRIATILPQLQMREAEANIAFEFGLRVILEGLSPLPKTDGPTD